MPITLDDLRQFTVARNFPKPATLNDALQRMGFVQADPIQAPARAQDLALRPRVDGYRAGADRFIAELDEEYYLHYAGHKDTLDLKPIYDRYPELSTLAQAQALGAAVDGDSGCSRTATRPISPSVP